ncbi:hemerythrin domain-containing protein [Desulfofustis limnaeus]|jgi:hemerythrin-like domain-containing protein|uniref:Hemerythrin n=1 Tax=Desulfofustis limnaeus TaxID=2740163 RepID=A0ABM7WD69_9BACT|nr:hemerythrin domain-containing protein [Desulfofustis limnaeus]MDX9897068.1 hemerythrin domain-containing protein [Desulfofustis sp.]BDD88904.1 hemerythrin [Desulfofustis limnaeus]
MRATEELMKEHEGIKLMLDILTAVARRIEQGGAVPQKDLEGIVEFLSIFADKCHHGKEENFLFPVLEQLGVPREEGPIGVMLAEHDQGREIIARLADAFAAYGLSRKSAVDEITTAAKQYVRLLRQHIDKENGILFPMAEGRISEAEDNRLIEEFEELEREQIGFGKHEEFHAMLGQLKETYLV